MKCRFIFFLLIYNFLLYGNDSNEIAAILRNEEERHFNELEYLKNKLSSLQRQIEELHVKTEKAIRAKDQDLRTFLAEQVSDLNQKIDVLAQKNSEISSNQDDFSPASSADFNSPLYECSKPDMPLNLVPAYNHPTRISSRTVWAEGSFTYWQASQDNMEIAVLSEQFDQGFSATGSIIKENTQFCPGFKVGTGAHFDYDKWDLHTEYTWFRSQVNSSKTIPLDFSDFPAHYFQLWPIIGSGEVIEDAAFSSFFSTWTVNMDIIDAVLGRWYYVGTQLTAHPYGGLRSAFIRQKRFVHYSNTITPITHSTVHEAKTAQNSNCWSIGPEIGADLHWTICEGLKLITSVEADLLYTEYRQLRCSSVAIAPVPDHGQIVNFEKNLGCLRAHTGMDLGISYGFHPKSNRCFIDFTAVYEFQAFFNQNMFRTWYGNGSVRQGLSMIGNLYIQGLTLSADLHF